MEHFMVNQDGILLMVKVYGRSQMKHALKKKCVLTLVLREDFVQVVLLVIILLDILEGPFRFLLPQH